LSNSPQMLFPPSSQKWRAMAAVSVCRHRPPVYQGLLQTDQSQTQTQQ